MKNILEEFIKAKVNQPKAAELKEILDCFEPRAYKKGDCFKEPFATSKEIGFLISGTMRLFLIQSNGEEVTGRIVPERSLVAGFFSLKSGEPTPMGLQCNKDVEMLVAQIQDIAKLLQSNLALNITLREVFSDLTYELGKGNVLFITGDASERYHYIVKNNPELLKNIPLHFIASMIGVTPTQLSRIRNKKMD